MRCCKGWKLGSLNDFVTHLIQWTAHNGEVQSLHRTAGPESLWKHWNRAPHTHTHSKMYVTHGAQWTQSPSIWRSPVCLRRNSDRFPGTQWGSHYWVSQRSQSSLLSSAVGLKRDQIPGHSSSIWSCKRKPVLKCQVIQLSSQFAHLGEQLVHPNLTCGKSLVKCCCYCWWLFSC